MKYEISIRVNFPKEIAEVLRREKERFIINYGSSYKSEPHITLYLDSYTIEGYPKFLDGLRKLPFKPFTISLQEPQVRIENDRHRNLYVMEISNKKALSELHKTISDIATPYRSPLIREKTRNELERRGIYTDGTRESLEKLHLPEASFDPHITLGEIDFDKAQADISQSQENLKSIERKELSISEITVFLYGKEEGDEKARVIEEVAIPFNQE